MSEVNLSNIYHRINSKGLLEAVDILTGRIVAVQHDHTEFKNPDDPKYTKVTDLNGNTVYVARELVVKGQTPFEKTNAYSSFFADLLVQKIVEGWSLTKACIELGLEYSIVNKWKNENMEFRGRLEDAFKDRAEKHADEIMEIAEESRDAKARIEARKWAAEKYSPERFGQKTKISGDAKNPLTFFIQTGVPEREEPRDVTPQAETSGHLPAPDEKLTQEKVATEVERG